MGRKLVIIFLFIVCACVHVCAQNVKSLGWSAEVGSIVGRGDSLAVTVNYTISNWNVDPSHAVVLAASLRNGEAFATLRPVTVYGRKVASQAVKLVASGNKEEIVVASVPHKLEFSVVDYIPVRGWMDTVRVVIENCDWSKRGGLVQKSIRQLDMFTKPARPEWTPKWSTQVPDEWDHSFRDLKLTFPVAFDEGSTKYDQFLNGNSEAQKDVLPLLKALTSSRKYSVKNASMKCYASPDIDQKAAATLTKKRAQSVYSFLSRAGAFKNVSPFRDGGGSDWESVERWIEASDLIKDPTMNEIMTSSLPADEKMVAMKRHCPYLWDIVRMECFPLVNRIEFVFSYKPIVLKSADFVRPVYEEDPRLLVPHDFYLLASDSAEFSDEWLDVMMTGASLWPEDQALNLNAAYGLLSRNRFGPAEMFLRNAGKGAWAEYARALWHCARGNWMEAEEALGNLAKRYPDPFFVSEHDSVRDVFLWEAGYVDWQRFSF